MKKVIAVAAIVLATLGVVGVGVDRAAASVVERTITEKIAQEFTGAGSVVTEVHGIPLLTQAARGSLDHVSVRLTDVAVEEGLALDVVEVDLYGVSTTSPRTADRVDAVASLGTEDLQARLGDAWTIEAEAGALLVSSASGLPIEATLTPVVRDGAIAFDLDSVSVFGVEVSGDRVPDVVAERIAALTGSIGVLPLGLRPTAITVTDTGVVLTAAGTDVSLESA